MNSHFLHFASAAAPPVGRCLTQRCPTATPTAPPIPTASVDVRMLRGGVRMTLRPVQPQDGELIAKLIAGLSPAGRRNRFHGAVQISADEVRRMCCIDPQREVAFVVTAFERGAERAVADARYCIDAGGDANADGASGAEFALMVDERWQRRGLGGWAMAALRNSAQTAGLRWLHGEVLSSNLPMLALMRCCGLCCTPDPEDDRLVQVQERLGVPDPALPGSSARSVTDPVRRTALQQLQNWITR